ncbi:hypothetical protein [Tenacibaculum sp. 190524A05c]|uniref:hypothetical protein n=1 Tax=Tenacibaculum platacis TaxID=3137852 RepID=UPI0031FB1EB8
MALQVTHTNGTVYLEGRINSATARLFIIRAEHFVEQLKNLTINVNKVNEIDRDGIEAFKTVWSIALRNNKKLKITGLNNTKIFSQFGLNIKA